MWKWGKMTMNDKITATWGTVILSTAEYRQIVEDQLEAQKMIWDLQEEMDALKKAVSNLAIQREKALYDLAEAQKAVKESSVMYWFGESQKARQELQDLKDQLAATGGDKEATP